MIGPSTSPRNRSMIVHAAPPATCRNISGQSSVAAIATTSNATATATITRPFAGHDLEVGPLDPGWRRDLDWAPGAETTVSAMPRTLPASRHGLQPARRPHRPRSPGSFSGGGGIRTRGPLARTLVFKTSAFDRSATPPNSGTVPKAHCWWAISLLIPLIWGSNASGRRRSAWVSGCQPKSAICGCVFARAFPWTPCERTASILV